MHDGGTIDGGCRFVCLSIRCFYFPSLFNFSILALYVRLEIRFPFVLWGFGDLGLLFENGILICSQKWVCRWISDMGFVDPWVFICARFSIWVFGFKGDKGIDRVQPPSPLMDHL